MTNKNHDSQEIDSAECTPVEVLPAAEKKEQNHGVAIRLGPLPDAEEMATYRERAPEAYELILKSYEVEGNERRKRASTELKGEISVTLISQFMVFFVILSFIGLGVYFTFKGQPMGSFCALVGALSPVLVAQISARGKRRK